MKRSRSWEVGALALSMVLVPLLACEAAVVQSRQQVADPFERTCQVARECPGRKCIRLGGNAQGLKGVCSQRCRSAEDCGEGAGCFAMGKAGPTCLATCDPGAEAQAQCEGGLVCVPVGLSGEAACFVESMVEG